MGSHDRAGAWRLETPDAHRRYYDAWAATYDADFLDATGYQVPGAVAAAYAAHCAPEDQPVADLGCGTGALGLALAEVAAGLRLDGFDISPAMADRARATGRYHAVHCVDLTTTPAATAYGAVVSSGTFTRGHLGPEGVLTAIALTRPGALLVLGINAQHFEEAGFGQTLARLASSGGISEPEITQVASYPGGSSALLDCTRVTVFRTAAS